MLKTWRNNFEWEGGGRREVSVISHKPVTSSGLKHERLFFRGSVSPFLQLVVPTFLEWIEPNFLSHGATLQHARPTAAKGRDG